MVLLLNTLFLYVTLPSLQSLNGIFINDKKIKAHESVSLRDQDIVRLGVPRVKGKPPEFVWKFCTSLKVKVLPNKDTEMNPEMNPSSQEHSPGIKNSCKMFH